jgi:hypothetical protein
MELTSGYRAAPGKCLTCGSADSSKPVVDLQVSDPGVLNRTLRCYLCGDCAMQAGVLVSAAMGVTLVDNAVPAMLAQTLVDRDGWQQRAEDAEALVARIKEFVP